MVMRYLLEGESATRRPDRQAALDQGSSSAFGGSVG